MNPELRRNLWLELTPHRLVAMPAVLALVLAFFAARGREWWPLVYMIAFWIFILLVHFWGTRQAAEAVTDEVRDRTWDAQRLSSLAPWQMSVGKLFGATAFAWYGALWCLVAMAIAHVRVPTEVHAAWTGLALVASGIALHGVALAGSLQAARKDSRLGTRLGTLLLIPVAILVASGVVRPASAGVSVEWYAMSFERQHFFALSAVAFAAWSVLAVVREMGRELKVRALPWAYPAFALFLGAYVTGFADALGRSFALFASIAFVVALALVYFGMFADVTTAVSLRRLALRMEARDGRRALEELPLWGTALVLAAVLAVVTTLHPPLQYFTPRWVDAWTSIFPLVLLLAAVRDAGLLVFFALAERPRRVESATLLYMALLWWIIPGLLDVLGWPAAAQAFRPMSLAPWAAVLVMAVHLAIVGGGIAWRWRKRRLALTRGV